jgi:hypothetical protein
MQAVFSVGPLRRYITRPTVFCSGSECSAVVGSNVEVNQRATEAEESPLLIFVTRKRLVKKLERNGHCRERLPSRLRTLSVEISSSVIVTCNYDL